MFVLGKQDEALIPVLKTGVGVKLLKLVSHLD